MEIAELLKKVRLIEIKARGLTNQIFSGEYHSAFKGRGMSFSEVREYQYGDEIRSIDWNVTARFDHPFVKVFEEERELTVMLLVDISASGQFGNALLRRHVMTEIAAVLAFSATQNNDKVGLIAFSDQIELFVPPRKGKQHVLRIIRDLMNFNAQSKKTNLNNALHFFNNTTKKRCTAFLMSDFWDDRFFNPLKIAAKKHDLIALKLTDPIETELPKSTLIQLQDVETGKIGWIDTSSKKTRIAYKKAAMLRKAKLEDEFKRAGIDYADINTGKSYISAIHNLFKKREGRR